MITMGLIYSTNPDFKFVDEPDEPETLPKPAQRLRLRMERAGRGGKTVTVVGGFVGREADLKALAQRLKQRLGCGGSAKDGEIVIQGDVRAKLLPLLQKEGYTGAR